MTEKLYYQDAYIAEFSANVLSVNPLDSGYDVVLDKTAFFPDEGGQGSDTGRIGNAVVSQVFEEEGILHHITDVAPSLGENNCSLDFSIRFEKMQCHTAEHILCGIIHRLFGLDNVGFHLGADEVTFDVNGILTREQLNMVEKYANISVPACGFSIGFERIITILKEKNHGLNIDSSEKIAFVIDKNIEESALKQVFKEAKELREKENKTVLVVYKSKNFKFQKEKLAEEGFNEIEFR